MTPEQLARERIDAQLRACGRAMSIKPEDLELAPFHQHDGLGKARQLFGDNLNRLLEELGNTLAA